MKKPWLAAYAEGIPETLPTPEHKSIRDLIESVFREFPDRPAFTNMGTTLTFSELDRLSMQFAAYLQQDLGLVKGERIAIMLPNVLQYPEIGRAHV